MKKFFKVFCAVLLCAVMLLSAASCKKQEKTTDETTEANKSTSSATEITFCLDWTPNTNHTGLFVALQNGYYDDAGLKVKIVQPPENGAVQCCAAGQAQFTIDAQDTFVPVINSEIGEKVTTVAAILQHNTSGIISAKGQGMDRPKGLEGNKYLSWDTPIDKAMVKYCVEKDGGDFSKVEIIPNTVTAEAEDVQMNKDHAIWVFYGWGVIGGNVKNIDTDFFYFKDIEPSFDYYTPTIVANTDFLKNNPETAKAFLEATKKGYEYAAEHPDESAMILIDSDTTGALDGQEELVKQSQKYISEQYISDAPYWGYIDSSRWNSFYKWLYDNKLIESPMADNAGFTMDYLTANE